MADATLTQDYLRQIFDYKNGLLYRKIVFNNIQPGIVGSKDKDGYLTVAINCKRYKVHRIIWFLHNNYWPKQIDHINGIKNDNRIENLREATISQNNQNAKIRKDNKSGTKGVCWNVRQQKWVVRIDINKKRIQLGYFKDLELADLVAQEARHKYHKGFARHF